MATLEEKGDDLPALERAAAGLLDRMEAHVHRPEGFRLRPVQDFRQHA